MKIAKKKDSGRLIDLWFSGIYEMREFAGDSIISEQLLLDKVHEKEEINFKNKWMRIFFCC